VDVAALTAEVFDKVRRLGDREWLLETAADVDAELDTQRVTQALVALADNAVRYTVPGDRISLGSQLSGGELRFWVSDTGPGVPESEQARVFERFARGTSGARRSDGAGLGLSVVQAIAVAHGGRAVLDSVPGRGTTVSLVLPARLAPPLVVDDAATTVDDAAATPELDPAAGRLPSGTRGGPS
jgi:signal transduction histidine kinase